MANILWVYGDHGCEFDPDDMTKLKNFTKGEIHEFLAFPFSHQLMLDQPLSN